MIDIAKNNDKFEGLFEVTNGPYNNFPCGEATPEDDQEVMREEVKGVVLRASLSPTEEGSGAFA